MVVQLEIYDFPFIIKKCTSLVLDSVSTSTVKNGIKMLTIFGWKKTVKLFDVLYFSRVL